MRGRFGRCGGRVGYAINNVLLYGTGGWAWSHSMTNNTIECTGGGCPITTLVSGFVLSSAPATANPSGWAAGGGIEWDFVPNWTVRVEYLHLQFEGVGQDFAFTSATGATMFAHSQVNSSEDTVRLGINYLFN
jgi:outer membrane immunogenic protein